MLAAGAAWARPVRRAFQPKDLDFREAGLLGLTLRFGLVRGQNAYRVSTPGFELALGLTRNLELDVVTRGVRETRPLRRSSAAA
jgi:hypothetical protein